MNKDESRVTQLRSLNNLFLEDNFQTPVDLISLHEIFHKGLAVKGVISEAPTKTLVLDNFFSYTVNLGSVSEVMMKPEDKERIIEDAEKLPKIQIVKKAVIEKKAWCQGSGAALCVAVLAVVVSLGVLVACMGYFGVLPEKVSKKRIKGKKKIIAFFFLQLAELGLFDKVDRHEQRISQLEHENICILPKVK